jgi:hypothetical protein
MCRGVNRQIVYQTYCQEDYDEIEAFPIHDPIDHLIGQPFCSGQLQKAAIPLGDMENSAQERIC